MPFQGQTAFTRQVSGILQHSSKRMIRCLKDRDCYNSTGWHPPGGEKWSAPGTAIMMEFGTCGQISQELHIAQFMVKTQPISLLCRTI